MMLVIMKILLALLWSCCSSALAFAPSTTTNAAAARHDRTEMAATTSRREIIWGTAVGVAGAATATVWNVDEALAAGVKELDMGLPSYGEIKSPKASVETVKSLSVDKSKGGGAMGISTSQKKRGGGEDKKKKEPKKEKTDAQGYIF